MQKSLEILTEVIFAQILHLKFQTKVAQIFQNAKSSRVNIHFFQCLPSFQIQLISIILLNQSDRLNLLFCSSSFTFFHREFGIYNTSYVFLLFTGRRRLHTS